MTPVSKHFNYLWIVSPTIGKSFSTSFSLNPPFQMTHSSSSNSQPDSLSVFEQDLLKQEYFFLQTTVEDYNKQIWVIKALGITGTGAAIVLALQQKEGLVALLGSSIPIFFWVLESQWKHFQRGFYPRIADIEEILLKDCNLRSPAIFGGWCHSFKRNVNSKRKGYFWDGLLNPSVFVSYVLEIVFLLALWRFAPFL